LELLELKATMRTAIGKGPARQLRNSGMIPAILYGPGKESLMLSVNTKELELWLKKGKIGQSLTNISIDLGDKTDTRPAMIKELQVHPVSDRFLHADFYEVSMDRKVSVKIPVVTKGKSKGVELGGMLQIIRRELEVYCFPNAIPDKIVIDITDLDMGDSVHVNDIPREADMDIPADVNFTVLTILSPKSSADETAGAAEGGEEEAAAAEE
jgi:large subunit ribosomal protein L25